MRLGISIASKPRNLLFLINQLTKNLYISSGEDNSRLSHADGDNILRLDLTKGKEVALEWTFDDAGYPNAWRLRSSNFRNSGKWYKYDKGRLDFHALIAAEAEKSPGKIRTFNVEDKSWKSVLGIWLLVGLAIAIKILAVSIGPEFEASDPEDFSTLLRSGFETSADIISTFTLGDFLQIAIGSLVRQPEAMLLLGICASAFIYDRFVPRVTNSRDVFEWRIFLPVLIGTVLCVLLFGMLDILGKVVLSTGLVLFVVSAVYRSSIGWIISNSLERTRAIVWDCKFSQYCVPQVAQRLLGVSSDAKLVEIASEISGELKQSFERIEAERDEVLYESSFIEKLNKSISKEMVVRELISSLTKGRNFSERRIKRRAKAFQIVDRFLMWFYQNSIPLSLILALGFLCFNSSPWMRAVCVMEDTGGGTAYVVDSNVPTLLMDYPRKVEIFSSWNDVNLKNGECR